MKLECVLFNSIGKEIDWYDPVERHEVIEDERGLHIEIGCGHKYFVPRAKYHHYIIREISE